jgi:anti-sigma B factor antagonist
MSLTMEVQQVGEVTVVRCSGQLTLGEPTSQFRNLLREQLRAGATRILLDLGQVTYLDSSALGELVGSYTSARGVGAQIKLVHLPRKIYDLLLITKLLTVFETFEDERKAIASFT